MARFKMLFYLMITHAPLLSEVRTGRTYLITMAWVEHYGEII